MLGGEASPACPTSGAVEFPLAGRPRGQHTPQLIKLKAQTRQHRGDGGDSLQTCFEALEGGKQRTRSFDLQPQVGQVALGLTVEERPRAGGGPLCLVHSSWHPVREGSGYRSCSRPHSPQGRGRPLRATRVRPCQPRGTGCVHTTWAGRLPTAAGEAAPTPSGPGARAGRGRSPKQVPAAVAGVGTMRGNGPRGRTGL